MRALRKNLISLVPVLILAGCGGNGSSNNDQGMSVSLLGLFQSIAPQAAAGGAGATATACGQLPLPLSGGYITLGQSSVAAVGTPQTGSSASNLTVDPSGAVYAVVGVQNNLFGQVFRADRVLLEYYIPGASIQPPSTNVAVNMLMGPADGAGGAGATNGAGQGGSSVRRPVVTSLPPGFNSICKQSFSNVPIIPAPIREWLNFNVNQLPEAPFDLEIVISLTGLATGGHRYTTNDGLFAIRVVPEVTVNPSNPTSGATSSASVGGATTSLSVKQSEGGNGSANDVAADEVNAQSSGLDELEQAFETESVELGTSATE